MARSGAKSTMLHGFGKNKIAAIPAIKSTIEKGKIISHISNYQNKGYDRYVIAARGKIDGVDAVMGVVVKSYKKHNNKFYLHEVEIIKAEVSSMTAPQLSVDTVNTSASMDSIPTSSENVKENSEKAENSNKKDAFRYQTRDTSFASCIRQRTLSF